MKQTRVNELSAIKCCIFTSFARFMGIKVLTLGEIHNKY